MRYAIKNKTKTVNAYQLGAGSAMEQELLRCGRIRRLPEGSYELFSLEAVNGTGEIAQEGDYFKVSWKDGDPYPYPNGRAWFEENHRHRAGDEYEQLNHPLAIWQDGDPVSQEIRFLLEHGKMTLNSEDDSRYFNAFLWGAPLSAARDATVILYSVDRDEAGAITDISFNFVDREIFERDYSLCEDASNP